MSNPDASPMGLTPAQRNTLYLQAAAQTGIHKPILAALHQVHSSPLLVDGETGLGISPVNRISLEQVNTFAGQVQVAASTLRLMIKTFAEEGGKPADLWDLEAGRYSERLLTAISQGFTAPASEPTAALLESSDAQRLIQAYLADFQKDTAKVSLPDSQAYLDQALQSFAAQVPHHYQGLPQQRDAILEALRIWRHLDSRATILAALKVSFASPDPTADFDLTPALMSAIQAISQTYRDYPYEREALLRLVQLWWQLESREAAIAHLHQTASPALPLQILDPALIALVQRLPQTYESKGSQRNSLVEGFRLWRQLDSRSNALMALGVNPDIFTAIDPQEQDLKNAAIQLDRALLDFVQRLPTIYTAADHQRAALIHLTQTWRGLVAKEQTIQSLYSDLKQMETARRNSPEASPAPTPPLPPDRPSHWIPTNLQLFASIVPNGSFTWAEATQGGTQMPSNQTTVDAMIRIAELAQQARDRLGRPFHIIRWYCADDFDDTNGKLETQRYSLGDAMTFYCDGLTGNQLYWFLDPWWVGGLGRFNCYPYLIHINAQTSRARWME